MAAADADDREDFFGFTIAILIHTREYVRSLGVVWRVQQEHMIANVGVKDVFINWDSMY